MHGWRGMERKRKCGTADPRKRVTPWIFGVIQNANRFRRYLEVLKLHFIQGADNFHFFFVEHMGVNHCRAYV